jgi:hypothetical protein
LASAFLLAVPSWPEKVEFLVSPAPDVAPAWQPEAGWPAWLQVLQLAYSPVAASPVLPVPVLPVPDVQPARMVECAARERPEWASFAPSKEQT